MEDRCDSRLSCVTCDATLSVHDEAQCFEPNRVVVMGSAARGQARWTSCLLQRRRAAKSSFSRGAGCQQRQVGTITWFPTPYSPNIHNAFCKQSYFWACGSGGWLLSPEAPPQQAAANLHSTKVAWQC